MRLHFELSRRLKEIRFSNERIKLSSHINSRNIKLLSLDSIVLAMNTYLLPALNEANSMNVNRNKY